MKTKTRQVIMEVCNWIPEREEANMHTDNILTYIWTTLENDTGNTKTQHLQDNMPPLQNRIADLTDKIGVGYFSFDYHTPPFTSQKKRATTQRL